MGTHISYAAFTTQEADAAAVRRAFAEATAEIQRLEELMTTWRPDSEISRINAAAGTSAQVPVSEETFEVLRAAQATSTHSSGAFDITFETLHGLWKFDEDLDPHPPTDASVAARLPNVGFQHLHLDETTRTAHIDAKKTRIGLGGIAKGYAVDRAAVVLERAKVTSFFVQAGGDLLTRGRKPDGSEWTAGIRDPRAAAGSARDHADYFAVLPVSDHAFSTAGDYERSYIVRGVRYHHILDPKTGKPADKTRSVSVFAKTAFQADALDDAVFVLGPEKGLQLVEAMDDVGAVIVDAANRLWISKRLEGRLRVLRPPTDGL